MTGLFGVAAHHIRFRSQCTLEEIYDTMLGIYLSTEVHTGGDGSPHGSKADNKGFVIKVIKSFRASKNPDLVKRADYIEKMRQGPKKSKKNRPREVALSLINMKLAEELRELEKSQWMDADIEPEYRG